MDEIQSADADVIFVCGAVGVGHCHAFPAGFGETAAVGDFVDVAGDVVFSFIFVRAVYDDTAVRGVKLRIKHFFPEIPVPVIRVRFAVERGTMLPQSLHEFVAGDFFHDLSLSVSDPFFLL
jgi:hypothetical protein